MMLSTAAQAQNFATYVLNTNVWLEMQIEQNAHEDDIVDFLQTQIETIFGSFTFTTEQCIQIARSAYAVWLELGN